MTKPKIRSQVLVAKVYIVLEEVIEQGVNYGWNRAHKHAHNPGAEIIKDTIAECVINAICERFDIKNDL